MYIDENNGGGPRRSTREKRIKTFCGARNYRAIHSLCIDAALILSLWFSYILANADWFQNYLFNFATVQNRTYDTQTILKIAKI